MAFLNRRSKTSEEIMKGKDLKVRNDFKLHMFWINAMMDDLVDGDAFDLKDEICSQQPAHAHGRTQTKSFAGM